MLVLLLLSIEVIAGFYWLKTSMDEKISRIETRLDSIEQNLIATKQENLSEKRS
jgi:hypothetical protein